MKLASDVPAVSSAVRILERLAAEWPRPVAPKDLIGDLGLNRSTCYNILATLQRAGWVTSNGDRSGWMLGPKLLTLTGVTDAMANSVAQQEIDELARRLGFVVFVAEPEVALAPTPATSQQQQQHMRSVKKQLIESSHHSATRVCAASVVVLCWTGT